MKKNMIKLIWNFISTILLLFIILIFIPAQNHVENISSNDISNILPFSLSDNSISYGSSSNANATSMSGASRIEILNKADAMTKVKWTPKYNLIDRNCLYVFLKGKTYSGIPYSMDIYQATSPDDFLSKIKNSKVLYGNDCSGFVSAAWGISRQTTLSLYNAVQNGNKIDGQSLCKISWDDLEPADALLLDNGKGKGHIMLYINTDRKNGDDLNVYEQDIPTLVPFESIPVARKDIRSKSKLIKDGYIPIRLIKNCI